MKKLLMIMLAVFLVCASLVVGCSTTPTTTGTAAPTTTKATTTAGTTQTTTTAKPTIDFPKKEITIIVGSGAGGGLDRFSRAIAEPVSEILGVPVVVTCVSGGAGAVALTQLQGLPADGYNLYAISVDILLNDALKKTDYTRHNLIPVLRAQMDQSVFWVPKNSPYNTMQELVEYAKANPGKINFGMVHAGGIDEVIIQNFCAAAGIKVTTIPYPSGSEALAALVGGHTDISHEEPSSAMGMFESGDIKPILALTEERLAAFPNTPTALEIGYQGQTLGNWRGLFVKEGTDMEIVIKLQDAFKKAMDDERYKKVAKDSLLDLRPGYASSADFKVFLEDQFKVYETILKSIGYIN